RIGVIGTTARWLVPPLLEAMAEEYPRVRVVVVDATTTSLLPQLHTGQLDLAVLALPIRDPDVDAEPLFEEELIVIAPSDHPLAAEERVTLDQLAQHHLLLEPPGTAFRDDLDAQAKEVGVTLTTKAEVDGMRLVASIASSGADVTEGLAASFGWGRAARAITACSGVVPVLMAAHGPAVSGPALLLGLADQVVMTTDAYAFVSGPQMVHQVTNVVVDTGELGGARVHASATGLAALVVPDLDAALDAIGTLLSF